ncbi:uncharacterized protein LOC132732675 [Ruditapes philippinarum]|uniref:uncharacterized protein LOC132732675 n=1 Tax=Ruditapes philippinarum TaxID=129788 RepID=UPI00295BFCC7|nr:uncharacterized protein LOC132732675 [Ruditapes philippinarum]
MELKYFKSIWFEVIKTFSKLKLRFEASDWTNDHETVWIGLYANKTLNNWIWQDHIGLEYTGVTSWRTGYPTLSRKKRAKEKSKAKSATSTSAFCVQMDINGWANDACLSTYEYICQTYTNGCTADAPYVLENNCYQLVTANTTVLEAMSLCSSSGGDLVMPKTDQINDYIYDINYDAVGTWIGLYRPEGNETIPFQWFDGDSITEEYLNRSVTHVSVTVRSGTEPDRYTYMTSSGYWNTANIEDRDDLSYICEYRILADCGTIEIRNGSTISQNTTEGSVHDVNCDVGYFAVNSTTSCRSNGEWYPTPTCTPVQAVVDCGTLIIDNGSTISYNTTEGNAHEITCNYGYIQSNCTTQCQSDGSWYPVPICVLDTTGICSCETDNFNITNLDETVNDIIKNLTINRAQLSRTRRKLSSADDGRVSSQCLGWSGIVLLAGVCFVLVSSDVINLLSLLLGRT